jgi:hypothetical protein
VFIIGIRRFGVPSGKNMFQRLTIKKKILQEKAVEATKHPFVSPPTFPVRAHLVFLVIKIFKVGHQAKRQLPFSFFLLGGLHCFFL